MLLEDQVCSLELAKKLKELGVKQDGLFYYQNYPYHDGTDDNFLKIVEIESNNNSNNAIINTESYDEDHKKYSAFTVSELGEMFPDSFATLREEGEWLGASDEKHSLAGKLKTRSKNEADTRAKIIIYLIENNLMEVPK